MLEGQRPQTKPETGRGPEAICSASSLHFPLNPSYLQLSRRSRQLRFTDPAKQWAHWGEQKGNGSVQVEGRQRTGVGLRWGCQSGWGSLKKGHLFPSFQPQGRSKMPPGKLEWPMCLTHCGHFGGPFFCFLFRPISWNLKGNKEDFIHSTSTLLYSWKSVVQSQKKLAHQQYGPLLLIHWKQRVPWGKDFHTQTHNSSLQTLQAYLWSLPS